MRGPRNGHLGTDDVDRSQHEVWSTTALPTLQAEIQALQMESSSLRMQLQRRAALEAVQHQKVSAAEKASASSIQGSRQTAEAEKRAAAAAAEAEARAAALSQQLQITEQLSEERLRQLEV